MCVYPVTFVLTQQMSDSLEIEIYNTFWTWSRLKKLKLQVTYKLSGFDGYKHLAIIECKLLVR